MILPEPVMTRSRLVRELRALGVAEGGVLMLHASLRSLGWVVGGPDVVLDALLEVLGPRGTLAMYVGWADGTSEMASWTPEQQRAYEDECPAFDPATSRGVLEWSVLTECLRTRRGACRSNHPEASIAAVGERAAWLTADHPLQYGYGPGSPLAKLVEARGQVLLLGSPLDSVTVLHYAECVARVHAPRIVRYRAPMLENGQRVWREIEELDTSNGIAPWSEGDYFARIVETFLDSSDATTGKIGAARCHLLDAAALVNHGVQWMERNLDPAAR